MASNARKYSKIVLAISFMFVLSAMSPALAGKGDGDSSSVVVLSSSVNGCVVDVKVKNLSNDNLTVWVEVEAVVAGQHVRGMTPVSVFAGSTANTVVGFTATVASVEKSGIIDDGNPN